MFAQLALSFADPSFAQLPGQLGHILYFIVGPLLMIIGIGYLIQRKLTLDMPTLTRLNFYFVVPAVIYFSVVTSELRLADVAVVIGFQVVLIGSLVIVTLIAAAVRRVGRDRIAALLMSVMFYNSGNYGLPLQDLAFRSVGRHVDATGLQVFVMIVQNFTGFTVGVFLAAAGGAKDRHWRQHLGHIARFPPLYALGAGLVTVQARRWLGDNSQEAAAALRPFWDVVVHARSAFVAVALATLGAQLALVRPDGGRKYPVNLSVGLRLLVAPVLAMGLIYAADRLFPGLIPPFVGQVLLIASATPTAVNAMLLCLEFDNHPDYLARAVFRSTLLSPVTVTLVIFLSQSDLFSPLVLPS